MRRDRVAVAVAREEDRVAAGDLPEQQRRRWVAVGRAHHFAVGDGQGRELGEAAAADDCEHGTCFMYLIVAAERAAPARRGTARDPRVETTAEFMTLSWKAQAAFACIPCRRIVAIADAGARLGGVRARSRQGITMYLDRLFKLMAEKQASDLFISCGAPINIKVNGVVQPVSTQPMDMETVRRIAYELMNKEQAREFENTLEMNLSLPRPQRWATSASTSSASAAPSRSSSATCAATCRRSSSSSCPRCCSTS